MKEVPQYIQQLSMGSMPKVEFTRAQGNLTQGISDQLYDLGMNIHKKDVEIQKIKAKTTLDSKLNELYQKHQNDPVAFQQEAEGFRAGFIKGIKSPDLSEAFNLEYESQYKPFFNKAVENKSNIQNQEHELALRTAIETSIETGARYVDGIQSSIPEHVMDTERALGKNLITFDELIGARKTDGSFMFSPAQQVAFKQNRQAKIEAKIKEMQNLKEKDFVAWAKLKGMNTDDIVKAQGNPKTASVLSIKEAETISKKLAQIEDGAQFVAVVNSIQSQYPGYEKNVMNDLARQGLPASQTVILGMAQKPTFANYDQQVHILSSVSMAKESDVDKAYKEMFPTDDPIKLDEEVAEEAGDYLRAAVNGTADPTAFAGEMESLRKMAKEYRRQNPNKSVSDAAQFATQWLADHYKIKSINGAYVQIPATDAKGMRLDSDMISDRLDAFIPFLDMKTVEDELKGTAVSNGNEKAIPVLNADGDGYNFISPMGDVVRDSNGNITEISIDQLLTDKTKLEKNKEELRRLRNELWKMPYNEREAYRKKMFGIE